MNLVEYKGKKPVCGRRVYIDPAATLIGDIVIKEGVGIWPGAVLRADEAKIVLEKGVMVLENAVIEAGKGQPVTVKSDSIISHGAIVHGASIGSRCIIGIGAMVLDRVVIRDRTIIGAGALVPPDQEIPSEKLVLGLPGKAVKDLGARELENIQKEWDLLNNKLDEFIRIRGVAF